MLLDFRGLVKSRVPEQKPFFWLMLQRATDTQSTLHSSSFAGVGPSALLLPLLHVRCLSHELLRDRLEPTRVGLSPENDFSFPGLGYPDSPGRVEGRSVPLQLGASLV